MHRAQFHDRRSREIEATCISGTVSGGREGSRWYLAELDQAIFAECCIYIKLNQRHYQQGAPSLGRRHGTRRLEEGTVLLVVASATADTATQR